MFTLTLELTDAQATDLLAKLQAQYGSVTITPAPVVTPAPVTPQPVPTPAPVVQTLPKPTAPQWHNEVRFDETTNARRNFNWLMKNCGSSWAYTYLYASRQSNLSNDLHEYFRLRGDEAEASRIINTFGNQGRYGPAGMLQPSIVGVRDQTLSARTPRTSIALPYPDNNEA